MRLFNIIAMTSAFGLLTACATQESALVSTNAVAMPAAGDETTVASKNIVLTGKSNAAPTSATASKQQTGKFAADDIVCKRKIVTGSRFAKRVCMSRAEWQGLQDLSKKTTFNFQSRGGRTNQPKAN